MTPKLKTDIIQYPMITEKASDLRVKENKLIFVVSINATKPQIRNVVEYLYEVRVVKVNTSIRGNQKLAFVKLAPENSAENLAVKLGIV